jgi:predicted ArsR family transcriptional regulator
VDPVDDFASQVSGISALAEPARRALYLYVAAQPDPVSRDQAAEGTELPRHTAKFHLDKLVDEGLLDTDFRRLSGRRGPGAGRPTKLYKRSARQVAVTLPARQYELAGEVLAAAVDDAAQNGVPIVDAVRRAAAAAGHRLGAAEGKRIGDSPAGTFDGICAALAAYGYEPRKQADTLVLANCPFHALARDHTELVCTVNLHLIAAMLEELGHPAQLARLDPAPDRCCVTMTSTPARIADA